MPRELKDAALSFRVTASMKQALVELADEDGRALADYLYRVLQAHLQEKGKAVPSR